MREVNYINEITFKNNDKIRSIVINKENLVGYFNDLMMGRIRRVIIRLIIPTNNYITDIIKNMDYRTQFKSITYTNKCGFISKNSNLYAIDSYDVPVNNVNIKMIRKDLFKDRIDGFIELVIISYDLEIEQHYNLKRIR